MTISNPLTGDVWNVDDEMLLAYFAGCALTGLISNEYHVAGPATAELSVGYATKTLAELKKRRSK